MAKKFPPKKSSSKTATVKTKGTGGQKKKNATRPPSETKGRSKKVGRRGK